MVTDTREAREREAMRRQEGSRMEPGQQPDAHAMGAESAEYMDPTLDPQWIDAWKMFVDRDGEYGVPARLPRGQYFNGGTNALENLRRPDGGHWFTLIQPERLAPKPQYECFVGDCRRKLHERIKLVQHVRAFHFTEAEAYKAILMQIEEKVAQEDPRLQKLLADMNEPDDFVAERAIQAVSEFTCMECGRAFGSLNALNGHKANCKAEEE